MLTVHLPHGLYLEFNTVHNSCVQMLCINTAMVWMARHIQKNMKTGTKQGY